ncbi:MAG: hypothetical protein K2N06_09975 [Oscillospiraceae bacterium]|nr:hypothetical protein [Oscillospiraceae bacterium]
MKNNWSVSRKHRISRTRAAAIRAVLRWVLFSAVLLIFYLFMGNPLIRGFCPLLIIPLATAVAMREGDLAAGIFGVFCGLMIDIANGVTLLGFSSLWLLIACPIISLSTRFWVKANTLSHFVMNFIVCFVMAGMDMLFLHWVWERSQSGISFVRVILPEYGGAALFSIPIYWLVALIRKKLIPKEQQRLEKSAQNAEESALENNPEE